MKLTNWGVLSCLLCFFLVGEMAVAQAGANLKATYAEGRRLGGQSRVQLNLKVPYPRVDSALQVNAFLSLEDPVSGIEFRHTQQLHKLSPDSGQVSMVWTLPWSAIIFPGAESEVRVRVRLGAPDFPGGFVEHESLLSLSAPERVWLKVEFGDFVVTERTASGRKWDRPFIFGNGIPEFFWSLEYGYETVYSSGYQKGNQFAGRSVGYVRITKGDSLELLVLEEDDHKRDFAGSFDLVPRMMNYSSLCSGDSLSFGQVMQAYLCARDDQSPFPGPGFREEPGVASAFFQNDSAVIKLRCERVSPYFGEFSYLQKVQVFRGEEEITALRQEFPGQESGEPEYGWHVPAEGFQEINLKFPAELGGEGIKVVVTDVVQENKRPVQLFRKILPVVITETKTFFPGWARVLGISLLVVGGLYLLARLPFVRRWLNKEPGV